MGAIRPRRMCREREKLVRAERHAKYPLGAHDRFAREAASMEGGNERRSRIRGFRYHSARARDWPKSWRLAAGESIPAWCHYPCSGPVWRRSYGIHGKNVRCSGWFRKTGYGNPNAPCLTTNDVQIFRNTQDNILRVTDHGLSARKRKPQGHTTIPRGNEV